jgi:hypothetical protein
MRLAGAIVLACCLGLTADALAQPAAPPEPPAGRKAGTYVKVGLAHWQGDIFSESSLTQWDVDLFGADYSLTSLNLEVDSYFRGAFVVSGFSLAYRKDNLSAEDSGHMLSGMLFRDFDLKVIGLKAGGGIEWGIPSMNFDQTEFDYAADGTIRYRHTYPGRNARVPVEGVKSSGTAYPFLGVSALERPGPLLIEFGMRVNFILFHFDDYEVRPGDQVTRVFDEHRVAVPYLFANVGLRLF